MAMSGPHLLVVYAVFCLFGVINAEYLGKFIGQLSELHHGVSGEVYAVDGRTIHIKDYTYDGQGPAAYFYASTYKAPDSRGFRLRDENNNGDVIRRYRKEGVTLTLPEGKTLNNIKIFYVWCEEFDVNFGDVKIPRNFDYPRPQKIDALKGVHQISSDNIVIVDAQTLLIPNLHYDGEAPDAKFWAGRGTKPSPQGIRIADENGKEVPLRRYDGKTVVLTLPGDLTIFDIGHFGIWCEQFTVDFAHISIPQNVNVPPSLKMLGVSPQKRLQLPVPDNAREWPLPQIGGHLQATTFRPHPLDFQRRHERVIESQYSQLQPNFLQPSYVPIQQQYRQYVQQPTPVGQYQQSNGRAVAYQPLNFYPMQFAGQEAYSRHQEQLHFNQEQFAAQFGKPRNRFDLQQMTNQLQQQNFVPFG